MRVEFSFPIIHAVNSHPNDKRLLNILRQRTDDLDIKRHGVEWMHECGSIRHTREVLRALKKKIEKEIEQLGGHSRLSALVQLLDKQLDEDTEDENRPNKHENKVSTL